VVPKSAIDAVPDRGAKPDAKELRLASWIIDSLSTDWDPARYRDTYTDQLRELIAGRGASSWWSRRRRLHRPGWWT
jgi:non-homologous end joining protein Ku